MHGEYYKIDIHALFWHKHVRLILLRWVRFRFKRFIEQQKQQKQQKQQVITGKDNNEISFGHKDDRKFEVHCVRLKEKLNRWMHKIYKVLSKDNARFQKCVKFHLLVFSHSLILSFSHPLILSSSHRILLSHLKIIYTCRAINLQRQDVIWHEDKIRYIFNRTDDTYLIFTKGGHFWW
jgi:hypothetical protein